MVAAIPVMSSLANGNQPKGRYTIEAVLRACDVLDAFQFDGELLRLQELVARTRMNKTRAFRLLCTLEERGLVERVGTHQYRSNIKPLKHNKHRLGYCAITLENAYSRAITESVKRAAADERIDLIVLDNHYNS